MYEPALFLNIAREGESSGYSKTVNEEGIWEGRVQGS